MPDRTDPTRYTLVAIILHWVMALGIISLATLGLIMVHVKLTLQTQFELFQLHKSIGITILLAAFLRIAWKLRHRPPELTEAMPAWQRAGAVWSHRLLYVALFALPLTGWAVVSASPFDIPTMLYGVIPWPDLPVLPTLAHKKEIEAILEDIHDYGAFGLIGLIVLHAGAALHHHFIKRDNVLRRMLPGRRDVRPKGSIQ
ncbi:cytochrome b [Acidiphilium acidophilum]|uniref:cytochrome b n=1 Tax=Acidiphilium acidophilum TaxID=76588 RepID=UPI002E8E683D|nr:cytochrome b [Acidiphilium acidophilum]